jgi:hypothetical protein
MGGAVAVHLTHRMNTSQVNVNKNNPENRTQSSLSNLTTSHSATTTSSKSTEKQQQQQPQPQQQQQQQPQPQQQQQQQPQPQPQPQPQQQQQSNSLSSSSQPSTENLPRLKCKIQGLVVIDVVEGTALSALPHMHAILQHRPKQFASLDEAILWRFLLLLLLLLLLLCVLNLVSSFICVVVFGHCVLCSSCPVLNFELELYFSVSSGMVKNPDSARVSIPSLLVQRSDGTYQWRMNLAKTAPFWEGNSPFQFKFKSEQQLHTHRGYSSK